MQTSLVRRTVIGLVALGVLALGVVLSLPWIASTQLVRDRIAYELSAWSGYRVALAQAPEIDVWPTFRARLHRVALYEWGNGDSPAVLEADRVEIDLSALAALRGHVVFSRMNLVRPLMRLSDPMPVFDLPASPGGGRMARAIETARGLVAQNPGAPDLSGLPSHPFGSIDFRDGRVAVTAQSGDTPILTGLSGNLAWPALDAAATLRANGIWRNEAVSVEAASAQPLILLAGGSVPAQISLSGPLGAGSFEGTANLSTNPHFDGRGDLTTPALGRALEWLGAEIDAGQTIGAAHLAGRLTGNGARLKVEDLSLGIADNAATGVIEIALAQPIPAVTGTLAFETIDLGSFLSAFTPLIDRSHESEELIDARAANQINLDLRLSAETAQVGSFTLRSLAASAQLKPEIAAFDISDASAFGGSFQAGVRIDRTGTLDALELRLLGSEIDFGAVAIATGAERFVPQARGGISAIIRGRGSDLNSAFLTSEGTVSASMGAGSIVGFNLSAFLDRVAQGEFFPLGDVADGALPISSANISGSLRSGMLIVDEAAINLDQRSILVDGIVPLPGRALALSGRIGAVGEEEPDDIRFFVGGGWSEPYVSPIRPPAPSDPD